MYLEYKEYKERFNGGLEESEFNRLERIARRSIDYQTYNRIRRLEVIPEEVKECVMDLIEYELKIEQTDGKEIASETVDTHTITYAIGSQDKNKKSNPDIAAAKRRNIIKEHLIHTGLMYRGVET